MLTKFLWLGKTVNLTGDNINISSNNFNVDKNGNMTCNNANMSNANINGGKILIDANTNAIDTFRIRNINDTNQKMWIQPNSLDIENGANSISLSPGKLSVYSEAKDNSPYKGYAVFGGGFIRNDELYNRTNSSSPSLGIDSAGQFYRSTSSSKRWKTDITDKIEDRLNPEALYKLPIKQYKYKEDYLSKNDKRYGKNILGFIAEDVSEIYEPATEYDEDGNVEMWNSNIMIPAILKLVQDQHLEIEQLQEEIKKLKEEK